MRFLLVVSLICCCAGYNIWPQPVTFTRGTAQVALTPANLQISTTSQSLLLKGAIARAETLFFPFSSATVPPNVPLVTNLNIVVTTTNEVLQLGVNENYTISLSGTTGVITAATVFGAMRGIESFAQLIDWTWQNSTYTISDTPVYIEDGPRFPWRGLMIDTGRHYLQPETILTMIDAIAYNKMNTLHWHMTDSQSFPLVVESLPEMAKAGAWAYPAATYTADDITTIVQYGYERGVRIVPEFDMPGHAYSWGLGYPNLTLVCDVPGWGTNAVTLNIVSNYTYQAIDTVLQEVTPLFMDDHIHFGSDEVVYQCWNLSQQVVDWMTENNVPTFNLVEQYFEDQLEIVTKKNQIAHRVFWEDAFANNGVKFDVETTTFEVWMGQDNLAEAVRAGYTAILASGYYLDVQQPGPNLHYEWVDTWMDFYSNEPFTSDAANLTAEEQARVLGGEACMWGEAVEDENIFSRVWIRASGAAEKFWSTYNFTMNPGDFTEAQTRLIEFRCRLKQRGIRATPLRPDYCPSPFM